MENLKRPEGVLLSEIQVLLAEKRTYFSLLRTGFGIITVPLSVIVFLTVTKDYHDIFSYIWLGGFVVFCLVVVSLAGVVVVVEAQRKIKKINNLITKIENEDSRVDEIVV